MVYMSKELIEFYESMIPFTETVEWLAPIIYDKSIVYRFINQWEH